MAARKRKPRPIDVEAEPVAGAPPREPPPPITVEVKAAPAGIPAGLVPICRACRRDNDEGVYYAIPASTPAKCKRCGARAELAITGTPPSALAGVVSAFESADGRLRIRNVDVEATIATAKQAVQVGKQIGELVGAVFGFFSGDARPSRSPSRAGGSFRGSGARRRTRRR